MPSESQKQKRNKKTEDSVKAAIITAASAIIVAIITIIGTPLFTEIFKKTFIPTLTPTGTIPPPTSTSTIPVIMTSTTTPISSLSSLTLKNPSKCDPDSADYLFEYALKKSGHLASILGKQVWDNPICVESSYQPFEGGEMIWRADDPDIYVLFATHEWISSENEYRDGDPEASCSAESLYQNRLRPLLGFGKIWCENQNVKEKLGYAPIGENSGDRAILSFKNGWLILINYTVRAIFYDEKQWESVDVFETTQISLESRLGLDTKRNLGLEQESFIDLPEEPLTLIDPLTGKSLIIPFDVRSKISTQCAYIPEYPDTVQIITNISRPIRVYLLIQAGWGVKSYEYQIIGKVSLKFDDNEAVEIPLILGYNIRDWADRSLAITTLVSPYTQTAWEGFDEVPGIIDILILDIPENYLSSNLEEIQIEDYSIVSTKSMDPCIHLSAVTVSHLP